MDTKICSQGLWAGGRKVMEIAMDIALPADRERESVLYFVILAVWLIVCAIIITL